MCDGFMAAKESLDGAPQKSQNADVNAHRYRTVEVGAEFIKKVEEFIDRHPELGWESVEAAVCHAWNNFVAEHEREKKALQSEAITPID